MSAVSSGQARRPHRLWAEETGLGRYQVAIHAAGVRFLSDQPVTAGGLGSGPTPHELVSGGLAACTVMTLRMYAEMKAWPLDGIEVVVQHTRAPAGGRDGFERIIFLPESLDDTQRARLLEIADRCPVHLLLESGADIRTCASRIPPADEETEARIDRDLQDVLNQPAGLPGGGEPRS